MRGDDGPRTAWSGAACRPAQGAGAGRGVRLWEQGTMAGRRKLCWADEAVGRVGAGWLDGSAARRRPGKMHYWRPRLGWARGSGHGWGRESGLGRAGLGRWAFSTHFFIFENQLCRVPLGRVAPMALGKFFFDFGPKFFLGPCDSISNSILKFGAILTFFDIFH